MIGHPVLAVSETVVACWTAALAGLGVAAVTWVAVLGGRAARRQREDGRAMAAGLTATLLVVWVLAGLAGVAYGVGAVLPR